MLHTVCREEAGDATPAHHSRAFRCHLAGAPGPGPPPKRIRVDQVPPPTTFGAPACQSTGPVAGVPVPEWSRGRIPWQGDLPPGPGGVGAGADPHRESGRETYRLSAGGGTEKPRTVKGALPCPPLSVLPSPSPAGIADAFGDAWQPWDPPRALSIVIPGRASYPPNREAHRPPTLFRSLPPLPPGSVLSPPRALAPGVPRGAADVLQAGAGLRPGRAHNPLPRDPHHRRAPPLRAGPPPHTVALSPRAGWRGGGVFSSLSAPPTHPQIVSCQCIPTFRVLVTMFHKFPTS